MSRPDVDDEDAWLGGLPEDEAAPDERTTAPRRKGAVIALVALAYLVTAAQGAVTVVGDLLGWASDSFWNWSGRSTSDGRQDLRSGVLATTLRACCLAGIGVVLGLWWRRRLVLAVSAVGVAAALVVGLGSYWLAAEDRPDRPEGDDGPRVCQEHSGGDTRCPGG